MALGNYTQLKAAVASWLHMSELSATIPDFITLAETTINRELFSTRQEVEETLTATIGDRYLTTTNPIIEPVSLWLTTYQPRSFMNFRMIERLFVRPETGLPIDWSIDAGRIVMDIEPDLTYTFVFRHRLNYQLSDANPTNWLLTNHPDVYLFGSLVNASVFIRDNENNQIEIWNQAFLQALAAVKAIEHRTKALSTLTTELSTTASNILEGYS